MTAFGSPETIDQSSRGPCAAGRIPLGWVHVRPMNDEVGTMRTGSFFGHLWRLCNLGILFSSMAFAQPASPPESPPELLLAARVLDIRAGSYLTDAAIVMAGGRIEAGGVATALRKQVPESAKIIDLGDATVLPGLIDCHTHLMA